MSTGAGVGIGVGIGCGAMVLATVIGLVTLSAIATVLPGPIGFLWPFIAILVVGVVMMFSPRTRPIATGILIVTLVFSIVVIGPCVGLLSGEL
ncbi:hypothetical protein [Tersicoccus solisilvae]|nr:hypothetical protein [Tersicoccus solisilvae]